MLNSRLLQIRYIDDKKDDDAYLYYNQFRRIRRISASERCNAIDGGDQIYDDAYQWDSHVRMNTYKLIGRKDMLVPRHTDCNKAVRVEGQGFPSNLNFERCNMYVVEATSIVKGYIYSKRMWYVDPETYLISWQETYDKNGKYWKIFGQITDDIKNANGDMRNFFTGIVIFDFIRDPCRLEQPGAQRTVGARHQARHVYYKQSPENILSRLKGLPGMRGASLFHKAAGRALMRSMPALKP